MQKQNKSDASKARITVNPPTGKLIRLMYYENACVSGRLEEQIFVDAVGRFYFHRTGIGGFMELNHAEVVRWMRQMDELAGQDTSGISFIKVSDEGPDFLELLEDVVPGEIDYTWELPLDRSMNQTPGDFEAKLRAREERKRNRKWKVGGAR